MGSSRQQDSGKNRRRRFIIEGPGQLSVVLSIVAGVAIVAIISAGAFLILPEAHHLDGISGQGIRTILLGMHVAYFILAAGAAGVTAIRITHRVVGPGRVLEKAVRGFREGYFEHRLSLRDKDYLKDLAAELRELGTDIQQQRDDQRRFLDDIEGCMDARDFDGARAAIQKAAERSNCLMQAPEEAAAASPETADPEPVVAS